MRGFIGSLAVLWAITSHTASAEDLFLPDAGLDADLSGMGIVPKVLTATRLKQPRSEVPGSMTVITAENIDQWGVRTVPELLRFVPGMFVKHADQDSVAYHASNPNLMRRMQVLIDGRSVYRAGIASVIWEDIPVALEDIQRIEVFRGPNASSYGANAFMAVINIVTYHPADTLGTRAFARSGHQGVRDFQISHSAEVGDWVYRATVSSKRDDGFDGRERKGGPERLPGDNLHDGSDDRFISINAATQLSDQSRLLVEAAYKNGDQRLRQNFGEDLIPPVDENESGFLMGQWQYDHSPGHTSQLRAYWQAEKRRTDYRKCAPAVALSPTLNALYQQDPYWALVIGRLQLPEDLVTPIALGIADPADVEARLEEELDREYDISQSDLDQAQLIFAEAGFDVDNLTSVACGDYQLDFDEQRIDVEWQDTVHWNDWLRTVAGINYRRDEVRSEAYFNGTVSNDLFRVFANAELRPVERVVLNIGGMYEDEDKNTAVFSPRVAANYLITPQQSLRLVYSTAVRSPDLLEQSPDYSLHVTDLTDNYLGLDEGTFFATQTGAYGDLDHERITSWELGYYGRLPTRKLEMDIKVYRDHLYQLISDPINLFTPDVSADTTMNIKGVDWQFTWQPVKGHALWYSGAYLNADVRLNDTANLSSKESNDLQAVETRLSSEFSHNLSWSASFGEWRLTQSYFWHRSYNNYSSGRNTPYRRYEMNLQKDWLVNGLTIETSGFLHRLIDDSPIAYRTNYIEDRYLGYVQVGVKF